MADLAPRSGYLSFEQERGVTAVTLQDGFAQVYIEFAGAGPLPQESLSALAVLRDAGVSIDLLVLGDNCLSFIVEQSDADDTVKRLSEAGFAVSVNAHRSLICVVAANMREMVGVMAKIAEALYDVKAVIEQTGDSHDRVMVLVETALAGRAVRALQRAFGLEAER